MDRVIFTPRLKLTLVTKAEGGSPELEWLHQLCTNEQAMWWSILGKSKSLEDTEKVIKRTLPTDEGEEKTYRVVYAVHEILNTKNDAVEGEKATEFIGTVNLRSLSTRDLQVPGEFMLPAAAEPTTLSAELAYAFLPNAWGKGYATESVKALFEACKNKPAFWEPFSRLYVRAIVNELNPASGRVMEKTAMTKLGVYDFSRKPAIFLAGEWREDHSLGIFGTVL